MTVNIAYRLDMLTTGMSGRASTGRVASASSQAAHWPWICINISTREGTERLGVYDATNCIKTGAATMIVITVNRACRITVSVRERGSLADGLGRKCAATF